mmetsp:Transcript_16689/g.42812  ORF Transcript_16689/g.42812 Transcript_16689/m.42812 type:complete len:204 (-) Transcript_16689:653-1264(-)
MWVGVPAKKFVTSVWPSSSMTLVPKSLTLATTRSTPSATDVLSSTLEAFRSPWMMPRECRYTMPSQTSDTMLRTSDMSWLLSEWQVSWPPICSASGMGSSCLAAASILWKVSTVIMPSTPQMLPCDMRSSGVWTCDRCPSVGMSLAPGKCSVTGSGVSMSCPLVSLLRLMAVRSGPRLQHSCSRRTSMTSTCRRPRRPAVFSS